MRRIDLILLALIISGLVLVALLFGKGKSEPKSYITKVTASEKLINRFTLNDSCAMLLNHVYFPPSTFVEFFYDSTAQVASVYGRLKNGVIRQVQMPAEFVTPGMRNYFVKKYVDQMKSFLTAEHDPYLWLVDGGVYSGVEVGIIQEDVAIVGALFERLWSPPFIVTKQDSLIASEYNLPPQLLTATVECAQAYPVTTGSTPLR